MYCVTEAFSSGRRGTTIVVDEVFADIYNSKHLIRRSFLAPPSPTGEGYENIRHKQITINNLK